MTTGPSGVVKGVAQCHMQDCLTTCRWLHNEALFFFNIEFLEKQQILHPKPSRETSATQTHNLKDNDKRFKYNSKVAT